MTGEFFVHNGALEPVVAAVVPLDDADVIYGYGVYETLKVRRGLIYFPERHVERLLHSAREVGIAHPFTDRQLLEGLQRLVEANRTVDANLKVLLYGGGTSAQARFYILQLAPLFPDRKLYRNGATAILVPGERWKPQAKSLNMLLSAYAYHRAQEAGAYDALLVNREGRITEGTRTNFWYTDGERIFTPPRHQVLEGVTQQTVLECLREAGIEVVRRELATSELPQWSGCFLTSTSTKVMPLRTVAEVSFEVPPIVRRVMELYDAWLDRYESERKTKI